MNMEEMMKKAQEAVDKAQALLDRAGGYLNDFATQMANSNTSDPWGDSTAAGVGGAFGAESSLIILAY